MKDDNIGCFGWLLVLIVIAVIILRDIKILSSDLPEWFKWYLLGR
jgi:hypothetical protein